MTKNKTTKTISAVLLATTLAFGQTGVSTKAPTGEQPKADNTRVNRQDRQTGEPTADQQKMNREDRMLAAKVRRAITSDKSLSTYAHNIKVISQNGVVTLKGPVRSDDELKNVVAKATESTGDATKIVNELTIAPKNP
jgi:hypothetical protein